MDNTKYKKLDVFIKLLEKVFSRETKKIPNKQDKTIKIISENLGLVCVFLVTCFKSEGTLPSIRPIKIDFTCKG